ncbi:MAG: RNA polymerase sigma factor [bacterium]
MEILNLVLWWSMLNRLSAAPPLLLWLLGAGLAVLALQQLSPRNLFARCAALPNDEGAWQEFFRRYRAHMVSAICRILGYSPAGRHYHLFPDVLQRVHLRLLENERRALRSFRGENEEAAQAYLRKIATGIALETLPQKGIVKLPLEAFVDDNDRFRSPTVLEQPGASEDYVALRQDIEAGLDKVLRGGKKYRNMLIFKLSFLCGFSPGDITRILGLKIGSRHAIEQLIYRMRGQLALHLRDASRN